MASEFSDMVEDNARFMLEVFHKQLKENLSYMVAGGQIPGIKLPTKAEVLEFFEQETTPEYWAQLAMEKPEEAYSQLKQWEQAQGGQHGDHAG